jgi:pimeloyl-ACP methyl ester carboxylesterase
VRAADDPNMRVSSATRASNSASPPAASSAPIGALADELLGDVLRHFASAEHPAKDAPGFQRTHVVADGGHSVQGDQPAALVAILRELAGV